MSFSYIQPRHIRNRWILLPGKRLGIVTAGSSTHSSHSLLQPIFRPMKCRSIQYCFSTKNLLHTANVTSQKKETRDIKKQIPELPTHGDLGLGRKISRNRPLSEGIPRNEVPHTPISKLTKRNESRRNEETRRIVVKRSSDVDETTNTTSDALDLRQRVGLINRRYPLEHEITDSSGKTIWIPAKTLIENNCIVTTQFPQINAASWLDPSTYCRGGGKNIAGTAAARQLLHGKRDLMEVLGNVVYGSSSKSAKSHQSILILGHGLPHQLLQHHIDSAAQMLERLNATEASIKHFNSSQHHNSTAASEAVRGIKWVHIRDASTGENRVVSWPSLSDTNWDDNLLLYWTVMNRIATRLGLAVLLKRPLNTLPITDEFTRRPRADYSLPIVPTISMLNTPPHHWRVSVSRHLHFLPEQFPPCRYKVNPIIEWTPLEGIAAPGHVYIRLQGESNNENGAQSISLCFDACFRTNGSSVAENEFKS